MEILKIYLEEERLIKYEKMKKYIMQEKQKLETDYNNNEVVQNLIRQNTDMKEQIAELEDRHRKNNL